MSAKKLHEEFVSILSMFHLDECDIPLVETAVMLYFEPYFKEQIENKSLSQGKIDSLKKTDSAN